MQKCNFTIISITLLALLASACTETTKDTVKDSSKETTIISGKICDMEGNNLTDVTVISGDKQIKTDSTGLFSLDVDTLIGNRCVLRIQKEGYFDRIYSKKATDTINYPIQLIKKEQSKFVTLKRFDAKEGAMIEANGATVTIPKSGLVKSDGSDYNGTVDIAVVYLSPTGAPAMNPLMPGADLMAIANDGDTVPLISYGMVNVEMTDEDGNPLQLKEGSEANLKYPAPKGFCSHDTIPLWYFNEENGLWIEEGYSTRQGDNYVGSVKHFTWWNCDIKLKNGARLRCRLINYTFDEIEIYAGTDSIIAWVDDNNTIRSNIFPNRPFTIAGVQMPALKPGELLDTFIVFNKIIFHDVNGNALSYVKFKINEILYYSNENGAWAFPCDENEKTNIRFQYYEPVTITAADFDTAKTCIVVCKPLKKKEKKQDKNTENGANKPETNNSEDEWKNSVYTFIEPEACIVFSADNDTFTGGEIKKEKLLSAKSISSRVRYETKERGTYRTIQKRYDNAIKYTHLGFDMLFVNQETGEPIKLHSDSEKITEEMKKQIEKTKTNKNCYVTNIYVLGGDRLRRQLPPIEVIVK
ncbi:MAG: hypothetical protein IKP27_08640 [Paludibacteraceae bacterium]|nr:hypothetical protein [Paludibacteraceae bacterium]